ncbi:MAG: ATP-binding protein [Myxococcota bacterium]
MLLLASERGFSGFTVNALITLVVLTFATSAIVAALIAGRQLTGVILGAQLAFDVTLATGFVYLTGGAGSFFTTLYGVTILAAALVSSPRAVLRTAAFASVMYVAVGVGIAEGVLPAPPDQPATIYELEGATLVFILLANLFGLAIVGALSLRLASGLDEGRRSLRRVEALNENIIESLSSGLMTVSPQGLIETSNGMASTLLGAELAGQPVDAFLPVAPDARGRGEGVAHRADGTTFPVGFTASPLRDDEGTLIIFTDLTEVRQLRQRADRAARLATLGRLSSALAHEIRNPLGSISGSVQLVRDADGLGAEDRALVDIVLREVDRLNGLVNQMLHVARPTVVRPTPTNLRELVDEVLALARADDSFDGLELRCQGEAHIPLDGAGVRQLLWNLLRNAAQASPPEGSIEVRIESSDAGVLLSVDDEGPGIPEEARTSLFEVFVSGHDHGIGLGLAVVKQVADGHDARVRIETSERGGARFVVDFPWPEAATEAMHP